MMGSISVRVLCGEGFQVERFRPSRFRALVFSLNSSFGAWFRGFRVLQVQGV